jgi:CopG family transcriptional regulator, nickel-responsive regulator
MKKTLPAKPQTGVTRISISLPPDVCTALDGLVQQRGFESRSQALTSMITEELIEHSAEAGDEVMTGTITLFYNQSKNNLLSRLASLKREHLNEVIGSLQVQLEHDHIMEVILIQGPAGILQEITNAFVTCKGVKGGKLTLTSTIIPQLHPLKK